MKTIEPNIAAAMEVLKHRIAHEAANVVASSDREVFKMLRDALPTISALIELHQDSECYCADIGSADKSPCPWCRAKCGLSVKE